MSSSGSDGSAATNRTDAEWREYLARNVRALSDGLAAVLFGDLNSVLKTADADPLFGNLAMLGNVVVNSTRNAVRRAEDLADELRRGARAAEEAEARQRAIVDAAFDAVLTADDDGALTGWNGSAARLLRRPADGWRGLRLADVVGEAAAGARERVVAAVVRRSDGVDVPVELSFGRIFTRRGTECVVAVRDLSEREGRAAVLRRAFEDLQRERDRVAALVDSLPDAAVLLGADGRARCVNRAFGALAGRPAAELAGLPADEIAAALAAADPDAPEVVAASFCGPGVPVGARLELRANGPRQFAVTVRDAFDGRLVLLRDQTGFHDELRERDAAMAVAAHELRTPLAAVKGFVDLVRSGRAGPLAAGQARFLEVASENVERLVRLVSDLLESERLARAELHVTAFEFGPFVAECVEPMRAAAAAKGLTFSFAAGAPVRVVADAEKLRRVVTNLVENAVKYTARGGVAVRALRRPDGAAVLEVEDSGIGVPADERARLFSRFHRASNARGAGLQGHGLGLAIVAGVVARLRGDVAYEPAPAGGSLFRVALPGEDDGAPARPSVVGGAAAIVVADAGRAAGADLVLRALGFDVRTTDVEALVADPGGYAAAVVDAAAAGRLAAAVARPRAVLYDVRSDDGVPPGADVAVDPALGPGRLRDAVLALFEGERAP